MDDINSDGYCDFGLIELDWAGSYGRVDFLFGGQDFDSLADWSDEESPVFSFGGYLDCCGDVNGDGELDFILVAQTSGAIVTETRIYFGGSALDTLYDWQYTSLQYYYCDGLGDVNDDNFADILISGLGEIPPLLFFGGNPMDTIPDMVFNEYSYNKNAAIGDVNADGYNDFSLRLVPGHNLTGRAIYFGGPEIDDIPDAYLQDDFGDPTWAPHFITHGDVNGDGIDDIITGDAGWGIRVAYVYLGSPWFNPVPDAAIAGLDPLYGWGEEISVGDVNGDGRDEILISAAEYWFEQGVVFLYTGPEEWIDYGAGVEPGDLPHTPGWHRLDQNYPNPFNATTTIHFELGKISTINIAVYDLRGNRVQQLVTGKEMIPGGYNVTWNGKNDRNQPVSSGMYLLEFRVDQYRELRKMVLLR
ncbi:MAG: FG-GAP-like repeat-containing protein [Planctomycetota bacterium]|jgi:hypothetical protein